MTDITRQLEHTLELPSNSQESPASYGSARRDVIATLDSAASGTDGVRL